MASYIAEILASADEIELAELNTKVKDINEQISVLKNEVKSTMENKYIQFMPYEDGFLVESLFEKATLLSSEIETLHTCIEKQTKKNLTNSTEELKTLRDALQENICCIKIVKELLELDIAFEKAEEDHETNKYVDAALILNQIESQLIDRNRDIECLDIYKGLRSQLVEIRTHYMVQLAIKFRKYITWSESLVDKKFDNLVLTIDVKEEDKKCIKALHCHQNLPVELKKFADKLFKDILCKIITNHCKVNIESISLCVISNNLSKSPSCISVLNNLTIVLNFVDDRLNVDFGNGECIITMLAKMISEDFVEYLIKHCLTKSVPRKREELSNYNLVVAEIVKLNALLLKLDFIKEGDNSIMEYAENIDVLFANKTCQRYLEAARNIMKKDLCNMVQVLIEEKKDEENTDTMNILTELSDNTFQFPLCQISTSTLELLNLVEEILTESCNSNGSLAVQLFCTARNIFKMYYHIVPEFHSKLLETIPQQSALFHNNCLYLAHKLQTLNIDFKKRCTFAASNQYMITFVDLIGILRCHAAKVMQEQLVMQRKQLNDIICDSGLVTLSDNPKFPQGVEKAIRQCLRQLALLQKVWQHVLPIHIYCKILGLLCNNLVEEIFLKVIAAKDIPEDTAAQLVSVFVIIQQKGPLVFPEPKEIHYHVKSWNKFCELVRLLDADLLQVDDRWSDGKGPLALEFKPEQVKQMIRALFQISDKRAALIDKIK